MALEAIYSFWWAAMDEEAKGSLVRLHEQLVKEARHRGDRPCLGIIRALVDMTDEEVGRAEEAKRALVRLEEQLVNEARSSGDGPRLRIIQALVNTTDEGVERVLERYKTKRLRDSLTGQGSMTDEEIEPEEPEDVGDVWEAFFQRGGLAAQACDWDSSWPETEEWSWGDSSWHGGKLYVGNLPAEINEEALYDLFGPYGRLIEVHVMGCRQKGTRRSCAFIVFASSDCAEWCLMEMSGYVLQAGDGPLTIRYADHQQQRGRGSNDGKGRVKGRGKRKSR